MKLSNIRQIGRFENPQNKREYNVWKGRNMQRGTDHLFYLYMGKRMLISPADFYGKWKQVQSKF